MRCLRAYHRARGALQRRVLIPAERPLQRITRPQGEPARFSRPGGAAIHGISRLRSARCYGDSAYGVEDLRDAIGHGRGPGGGTRQAPCRASSPRDGQSSSPCLAIKVRAGLKAGVRHPCASGGNGDPEAGRPGEVIGRCAVGADTAGPGAGPGLLGLDGRVHRVLPLNLALAPLWMRRLPTLC